MAFNPFHRFRKHQKAVFAVLTIICMFVFVLQFGRGDAIERLMNAFGAGRARGEYVTTLNGKKIYEQELTRTERNRQIANIFLNVVMQLAREQTFQDAKNQETAAKPEAKDSLVSQIISESDTWRRFAGQFGLTAETRLADIRRSITMLNALKKNKPEKAPLYDALIAALNYEYFELNPQRNPSAFFFGGSSSPEDLLDFILWKQQAERMGVVLNDADMRKAVNVEVGRADFVPLTGPLLADERIRGAINRAYRGLPERELEAALIDEFRVAMVQEALLGEPGTTRGPSVPESGIEQAPVVFSPLEFLHYFRENRTTLKLAMLALPVSNFQAKVTAQPSEKELARLFEKYQDQEPVPERDAPGFKEPRRVKVEYVTASADSPFYQAAAINRLILPTTTRVGAYVNTLPAGGGVGWAASAAALLAYTRDPIEREYDKYKELLPSWIAPVTFGNTGQVHDTSLLRPETFAAFVGQTAASTLSATPLWLAPESAMSWAYRAEIQDRLRAIPASVLAGAVGATDPLAVASLALPFTPGVLSLRQVQGQMVELAKKELAPELLHENLFRVFTEIRNLKGKPEETRKFIDKSVKDLSLTRKEMTQAKDQYAIVDDPAMKALKDAFSVVSPRVTSKVPFDKAMFLGKGDYEALLFSSETGVVTGQQFEMFEWFRSPTPFVFWRTEDKPARVRTFEEARAEVTAAWKWQEAQRLARKEAERISDEAKKQASPATIVPFLREQKQGPVYELSGVCMLVRSIEPGRYQDYRIPGDIMQFPRANLLEMLMTMKKPSDSVVVRDRPEAHYYVAVLQERSVPGLDSEFVEAYEKTPLRDSDLQKRLLAQRRRQFRSRFMDQLRAEAGPVDGNGRFKLPANLNLRRATDADEG